MYIGLREKLFSISQGKKSINCIENVNYIGEKQDCYLKKIIKSS